MQTLDAPVYEVKQDSEWYKNKKAEREAKEEFFKKINSEYFEDNGFGFYNSENFGVDGNSKDYETYKSELKKNPDKNGMYEFKKRSKHYPIFKEMLEDVLKNRVSPFKSHDVFGMNNMNKSQWVGDRWFYGVHDPAKVVGDEVEPIEYKEYLQTVMEAVEE